MRIHLTARLLMAALLTLVASLFTTPPASAQSLPQEPSIRNLMSLGVAMPVSGKLLAGSIMDVTDVTGGTTQNADNTLNTLSLDDEFLAQRNRGLLVIAWGTTAANGNTKDLKLFLGATAVMTIADSTASGKDFLFLAFIASDGVDSQRGTGLAFVDGAIVAATSINMTAATEDANVTKTIKTTGNNNSAAASAATGKGLVVIPVG